MKSFISIIIVSLICLSSSFAQDLKAFQIYDKENNEMSFQEITEQLQEYDVVLFGEYHNNSIIHWLQLRLTKNLHESKGENLILGAEMFERDNQDAIDLYLKDSLDDKQLAEDARLWTNYKTDYKPLLDFAKTNHLSFIATNIPRRYASIVSRHGMDSLLTLPDEDKKHIAELPIIVELETPGYPEMVEMMKDHASMNAMDFVSAQAVKDATMAESIFRNLNQDQLFIHFNGHYHSKEYGGIYWYLKKLNPDLKIAVISVFLSDDDRLRLPKENLIPTEYNLVIPEDMTKTF